MFLGRKFVYQRIPTEEYLEWIIGAKQIAYDIHQIVQKRFATVRKCSSNCYKERKIQKKDEFHEFTRISGKPVTP